MCTFHDDLGEIEPRSISTVSGAKNPLWMQLSIWGGKTQLTIYTTDLHSIFHIVVYFRKLAERPRLKKCVGLNIGLNGCTWFAYIPTILLWTGLLWGVIWSIALPCIYKFNLSISRGYSTIGLPVLKTPSSELYKIQQ